MHFAADPRCYALNNCTKGVGQTMKKLTILLLVLSLAAQTTRVAAAEDYDVVILNGRVMDPETQFDGIRNVGIKDGNITTITKEKIAGTETIDATGHVVAPGFIDTQAHSQGSEWGVKVQLRDGVTTPMDFEIGAINVAAWYTEKDGKWQANFGTVAAHEYHRMRVLDKMPLPDPVDVWKLTELRGQSYQENDIPDWAETVSDLEQLNAILKGLDDELRDGARVQGRRRSLRGKQQYLAAFRNRLQRQRSQDRPDRRTSGLFTRPNRGSCGVGVEPRQRFQ